MGKDILLHFSSKNGHVDHDCDTARLALHRLPNENMQSKRRPLIVRMSMQIPDATTMENPLRQVGHIRRPPYAGGR